MRRVRAAWVAGSNPFTVPVGSNEWTVYPGGASEAARLLGIKSGNVTNVCTGKQRSAYGYVFEYDQPTEVAVLEGEEWREVVVEE